MPLRFADMLDARLGELTAEGYEIRRIFAPPAHLERLFIERGDAAILLDCDVAQDRAWYGQYEICPGEGDLTMIMHCRGDECWVTELKVDAVQAAA